MRASSSTVIRLLYEDACRRPPGAAGAPTSTRTASPPSRSGCGRRTTDASRRGCSACWSSDLREQAHASWPRALAASLFLTKAAAGFARSTGDYERFAPDVARGYRLLGLPSDVDLDEVARWELRWWVVRREIGLAAGEAAGETIARLYAALYDVPLEQVAEAGRLRGIAAEVRDRGATADPDGPKGPGARLLARSRPLASRLVSEPSGRGRSLSAAKRSSLSGRRGGGRRPTTRRGRPRPRAGA